MQIHKAIRRKLCGLVFRLIDMSYRVVKVKWWFVFVYEGENVFVCVYGFILEKKCCRSILYLVGYENMRSTMLITPNNILYEVRSEK